MYSKNSIVPKRILLYGQRGSGKTYGCASVIASLDSSSKVLYIDMDGGRYTMHSDVFNISNKIDTIDWLQFVAKRKGISIAINALGELIADYDIVILDGFTYLVSTVFNKYVLRGRVDMIKTNITFQDYGVLKNFTVSLLQFLEQYDKTYIITTGLQLYEGSISPNVLGSSKDTVCGWVDDIVYTSCKYVNKNYRYTYSNKVDEGGVLCKTRGRTGGTYNSLIDLLVDTKGRSNSERFNIIE